MISNILHEVLYIDARALLGVLFWESLATVLIILGIRSHSSSNEKRELVNRMILVRLLYTFGYMMLFLRGKIPDFFSANCGNTALYVGYYLENCIFMSMLKIGTKRNRNVMFVIMMSSIAACNLQEIFGYGNYRVVVASMGIFSTFAIPAGKALISRAGIQFNFMVGMFYLLITASAIPRFITAIYDAAFSVHTIHITQTLLYLGLLLEAHGGLLFFFLYLKVEADQKLAKLAATDGMTGLVNRRAFLTQGKEIFEDCRKKGGIMTLLFLDVDDFKTVNDRFGHGVGDEVLIGFGEVLIKCTRLDDICCRYGGDEFLVLLRNSSMEAGINVAKRILGGINEISIDPDVPGAKVASSVGIICGKPQEKETFTDFIGKADRAMYAAKEFGKNQIFVCDNMESEKLNHII